MKLLKELQRRHVLKAAITYLVFSWLVIQIVAILFPILQIDLAYQRWVLIALGIGFPFWIVLTYIYDWTPQGFKKTPDLNSDTDAPEPTKTVSTKYIIIGLSLAIVLLVGDKVFNLTGGATPANTGLQTLAILPFSHLNPDGDDEFFTSGVHEDIMTKLAGVKTFRIISKASVMPYKDYEGDLKLVGEKLNTDYIMQGSVRRWNNDIKMTVQLIDSDMDQVIWSDEYTGKLENVFALQSDIATVITQKLQANLSPAEATALEAIPTKVLSAYDDFLKARFLLNKPRASYDDLQQAVKLLNAAVAADDQFAKAWSLLVEAHSEIYNQLSKIEGREADLMESKINADLALAKAKSLAPNSWEVLSEEGIYNMYIKQDNILAMTSFEKALEQNPSDVVSMFKLAQLYVNLGDLDKASNILERAFKLVQTNGYISYSLSFVYELKGEYNKMIPLLNRLYELYPDQKHYLVEAKYYQFLETGSLESFKDFQNSLKQQNANNPWDERSLKNMDMIVAMFNNEFDTYHQDWKGKNASHIQSHGDWMCPLVTNDFINQARLLKEHHDDQEAEAILEEVKGVVLKPVNPNSVCVFDPNVYMPKLDYFSGNTALAKEKIEAMTLPVLKNESFPLGAVERTVMLEAVDLIMPEKVYYYYEQVVKNSISMTSFESICADPWTYPNLIKDPRFIAEVKQDGRFVDFLSSFGFI